eukprot:2176273-Prymnesium_polylepis.1
MTLAALPASPAPPALRSRVAPPALRAPPAPPAPCNRAVARRRRLDRALGSDVTAMSCRPCGHQ